jgi:flotillin
MSDLLASLDFSPAITGAAIGLFLVLLLIWIVSRFLYICGPEEVLIFSGRQRKLASGERIGYQVMFGGRKWKTPVVERVDRMDLRTIPIDIKSNNAYSKGGIPLALHAIAMVKVTDNPKHINNAIERFLGRDISEIRRVAKETLEGHLRGVVARLTPEEVNEDRLKFAAALQKEVQEDFTKLGIYLDILKIQSVQDDVNYLASIGRERIAIVLRDAEVAESTCKSLAEQAEADAGQDGEVANQKSKTAIVSKNNEVKRIEAELEAEAAAEEERTIQAALHARAKAEHGLQEVRKIVEKTRLIADIVLPAQAEQEAEALRARGEAAQIEEQGRARARALDLMTEAWKKAGKDAKDIFLIQNLETVLETVVTRVNAIKVKEVNVLDSGNGAGLATYASAYPAMVAQVLGELERTTGVDVLGILAPEKGQ